MIGNVSGLTMTKRLSFPLQAGTRRGTVIAVTRKPFTAKRNYRKSATRVIGLVTHIKALMERSVISATQQWVGKSQNLAMIRIQSSPLREDIKNLLANPVIRAEMKKKKQETACLTCHRDDDLHRNQEGKACERCHIESGWGESVFFEHDLTRFPLVGQHGTVSCESCHLSPAFKDVDKKCSDCHKPEDAHESRLGDRCEQCHNPTGWNLWEFSHDSRTEYSLNGSHQDLVCNACHTNRLETDAKPSKKCQTCHRKDDIHRGRFGRICGRCHTENKFSEITLGQGGVR